MSAIELELRGQRRFRGSVTGNVRALVDGRMVYADGVSLSSAKSRANFVRELERQVPDSGVPDRSELEAQLLRLLESAEEELERESMPDAPSELDDEVRVEDYSQRAGRYHFIRIRGYGDEAVEERLPLCNFTAIIREEVVVDDGADARQYLCLEGHFDDGRPLPSVRILAAEFSSMGWVLAEYGASGRIFPGAGRKDWLRDAIQAFSVGAPGSWAHRVEVDRRSAGVSPRGWCDHRGWRYGSCDC
jgi:hypothetical protein